MNWLYTATIIIHVLLASSIVGLVLLQRGRGADAGAGFGAGASGTVFGARGSASFLSRSTATLAGLFIATSLVLAYLGSHRPAGPGSVTERVNLPSEQPAPIPATPGFTLPSPTVAPDAGAAAPPAPVTDQAPAAGTTNQGPPTPAPQQPPNQ